MVVRVEFRAEYWCPNIFHHKMITNGWILMFQVSIELYWSAQHDRVFESGWTAFLVAKFGTKRFIHIWAVWRAPEMKFRILTDYPQIYYWHLFWCHGGHLGILWFRIGPLKPAPATCSYVVSVGCTCIFKLWHCNLTIKLWK